MTKKICVCGVHTDVGKTYLSAAICAGFGYEYFKLIQAGYPTDSDFIRKFDKKIIAHKEGLVLKTPASPHFAMQKEGLRLCGLNLELPNSNKLLIELAGGLFTPLDNENFMIDFIIKHSLPVFLVYKDYLGCINHTSLSIEILLKKDIKILAVVCSSSLNKANQNFLKNKYKNIKFLHLPNFEKSSLKAVNSLKNQIFKNKVEL